MSHTHSLFLHEKVQESENVLCRAYGAFGPYRNYTEPTRCWPFGVCV